MTDNEKGPLESACYHAYGVDGSLAEAALAEYRKLMERVTWQPMETAPKDGTKVLLSTGWGVQIGAWYSIPRHEDQPVEGQPDTFRRVEVYRYEGWPMECGHHFYGWMPLPDWCPPATSENGK